MTTRLLLVRHGQSTWNAAGRWQGWADPPLSPLGAQQARQAALALPPLGITAVASSDLARARRTAEILARALGTDVAEVDPALREYDVGDWCGLTRPEIEARWPGLIAEWHAGRLAATPGGETRRAFVERGMAALTRLAAAEPGRQLLVVTHGGLVRAVERRLGVSSETIPNLSGRWIEASGPGHLSAGERVLLLGEEAQTLSPSA